MLYRLRRGWVVEERRRRNRRDHREREPVGDVGGGESGGAVCRDGDGNVEHDGDLGSGRGAGRTARGTPESPTITRG